MLNTCRPHLEPRDRIGLFWGTCPTSHEPVWPVLTPLERGFCQAQQSFPLLQALPMPSTSVSAEVVSRCQSWHWPVAFSIPCQGSPSLCGCSGRFPRLSYRGPFDSFLKSRLRSSTPLPSLRFPPSDLYLPTCSRVKNPSKTSSLHHPSFPSLLLGFPFLGTRERESYSDHTGRDTTARDLPASQTCRV